MRRRRRLPPEMTGVDVLLAEASEALERRDELQLPGELVEAFRRQLLDAYVRPADMSDPTSGLTGPTHLADLRPEEVVAQAVVGAAIEVAYERGDPRTQMETLRIGIVMAMRFGEYLREGE